MISDAQMTLLAAVVTATIRRSGAGAAQYAHGPGAPDRRRMSSPTSAAHRWTLATALIRPDQPSPAAAGDMAVMSCRPEP